MEAGTFLVISYGISVAVFLACFVIAWWVGPDHEGQRMLDEMENAPSQDDDPVQPRD